MPSDEHLSKPDLDAMIDEAYAPHNPNPDGYEEVVKRLWALKGTPEEKRDQAIKLLATLDTSEAIIPEALNWEQFLKDNPDDSYEWVIDDLLEVGERVVVVAAEGVGKTMLARQVAISVAAGVHPFTYRKIRPVRTLTFDVENPKKIIQRTSRRIMRVAREQSGLRASDTIHAYLHMKPEGINLLSPEGRRYTEELMKRYEPEILFMGPLYKSFIDPGGRSPEAIATEIAMFYDYLRTEYNCCLWLEQHAPLGNSVNGRDLRPFGSAVWSRWPEFGPTISKDPTDPRSYEVKWFRGSRDQRDWPEIMVRGGEHEFPFVVTKFLDKE